MQLVTLVTLTLALTIAAGQPAPQPGVQRFDYLVRADFFAGVAGDEARMKKAIDLCDRTLAENPNHPEALAWHGAATLVQSGQAFRKGDLAKGGELWGRGLEEMNRAAALAPDNVGVLIPRGATLLEATRNLKPDAARPLIESAVSDYERVLAIQTPYFSTLGDHAKGELLFGLADGFHRLGRHDKARAYFERLIAEAPGSGQASKAREWLANGSVPKTNGAGCVGCHK